MNKDICPVCEELAEFEPVTASEVVTVRDIDINVKVKLLKCGLCKKAHRDQTSEDPLEDAYRQFRSIKGMVQPEEMKRFRNNLGLTQGELSRLLGWGAVTLSRYERGALQDDTHDRALRMAMTNEGLLQLIGASPKALPAEKHNSLRAQLSKRDVVAFETAYASWFDNSVADEYNGYNAFNHEKFQNAVCFFAKSGVSRTKLNKLLFYSDFLSFKVNAKSITGTKYIHLPYGPVPNDFEFAFANLCREGYLRIKEVPFQNDVAELLVAQHEADLAVFSKDELRVLQFIEKKFRNMNAEKISDLSHGEKAYLQTTTSEEISYLHAKELSIDLDQG